MNYCFLVAYFCLGVGGLLCNNIYTQYQYAWILGFVVVDFTKWYIQQVDSFHE